MDFLDTFLLYGSSRNGFQLKQAKITQKIPLHSYIMFTFLRCFPMDCFKKFNSHNNAVNVT